MSTQAWLNLVLFMAVLTALAPPTGRLLARIARPAATLRPQLFNRLERGVYQLSGVDPTQQMGWKRYLLSLMLFNIAGVLAVFVLQMVQQWLPLNPQHMGAVSADSAFNTAVSFVTNTNWQGYGGETTMSYLVQMAGLAVQNFLSAATGIAVVFALIRGFASKSQQHIGNFWVDITRVTLYALIPLSIILALVFVSQGVIQNFSPSLAIDTLDGGQQTIAMGPVASQEAIKLLGTNGGGFFNVNSAHPFENPGAFSNFAQMIAILLIPAGLCFCFGRMVGDRRQGWTIYAAMSVIFVVLTVGVLLAEQQANPALSGLSLDQASHALLQSGGNMEGKEVRFGIVGSALFASVTTAASCGAVVAMHDSFMPLGGMVPLLLMQLGEVVFGGVGSGLYGMLIFVILAVFIAGLMTGRTPEYLGKKIEMQEMKMIALALLVPPFLILAGTALSVVLDVGVASLGNPGAHGLSEVLYAFTSAANNNGSAFAGLSANNLFYNLMLALAMFAGRFAVIGAVLAVAGYLAAKQRVPVNAGTMPTHGILFGVLLIGVVLIMGALTYIPSLALGPIAEHVQLFSVQSAE